MRRRDLLAWSLAAVRALPMGYEPDRVLLVNRIICGPAFSAEAQRSLRQTLLATATSLPASRYPRWRNLRMTRRLIVCTTLAMSASLGGSRV